MDIMVINGGEVGVMLAVILFKHRRDVKTVTASFFFFF